MPAFRCTDSHELLQVHPDWNTWQFDDSSWEKAQNYGSASSDTNHWTEYTMSLTPPYHTPSDAVSSNAQWIWTSDVENHDVWQTRLFAASPNEPVI